MNYIYPCNPNEIKCDSPLFEALDNDAEWIAEIKKNGWRCEVAKGEDTLELWTKHNTTVKQGGLDDIKDALFDLPEDTVLDGELITFKRIKGQADGLYLFDVLKYRGEPLWNKPYFERRGLLEIIMKEHLSGCERIELAQPQIENKVKLYWDSISTPVNEGIVLKKIDSVYPIGYNANRINPFWLKVKRVEAHVYA
jgi:ATP-dependent DNA ligase